METEARSESRISAPGTVPSTANAIARRWSRAVSTRPRGGRVVPCTCKSLPSAVASTPSARRLAAINSSRLLSFTRSSPTSRNTVSPSARLAVLASRAEGETVFREVGELRVKESNRLELIAANLRAVGVEAEARANDLFVCGTTRRPSGRIETARDYRLAMAFAVLGTLPGADVWLSERASVGISYPRFFADLRHIGKRERGKGKR